MKRRIYKRYKTRKKGGQHYHVGRKNYGGGHLFGKTYTKEMLGPFKVEENIRRSVVHNLNVRPPTKKEEVKFRRIFEKRPELLKQAKGLQFTISDEGGIYLTVKSGLPPKSPREELMVIDSRILREDPGDSGEQIEMKEKLKGTGLDFSGSILAHELDHRERVKISSKEELAEHAKSIQRLSDEVTLGKKTIKQAEEEYKQLPFEKSAFEKQLAPRARDIKVPREVGAKAFRETFK